MWTTIQDEHDMMISHEQNDNKGCEEASSEIRLKFNDESAMESIMQGELLRQKLPAAVASTSPPLLNAPVISTDQSQIEWHLSS